MPLHPFEKNCLIYFTRLSFNRFTDKVQWQASSFRAWPSFQSSYTNNYFLNIQSYYCIVLLWKKIQSFFIIPFVFWPMGYWGSTMTGFSRCSVFQPGLLYRDSIMNAWMGPFLLVPLSSKRILFLLFFLCSFLRFRQNIVYPRKKGSPIIVLEMSSCSWTRRLTSPALIILHREQTRPEYWVLSFFFFGRNKCQAHKTGAKVVSYSKLYERRLLDYRF